MENYSLKITAIGGIGQIGSNMTLVQGPNDIFMIDAGILFPYEDFFDINYLIPDLTNIPTPKHLIITHGHEDHIGAIYHIIKRFPEIKILASPFTASLIRKKLEFSNNPYPITEYRTNEQIEFNDFIINPIHVNHSIPETHGLLIKDKNEEMGFFFISDFKIDFKTTYEQPFDFQKLVNLSKNLKKRILLADSTNISSSILETPSEADILPVIDELFTSTQKRIFITCFSSNIHRLLSFLALAKKHSRKIIPHGRSMINYLNTANEQGMIPDFESIVQSADSLNRDNDSIIVLLSGCQADFRGTFRRFCMGEDSTFKPRPDDLVILSSKAIPGNEKKISLLINKLSLVGARIITAQEKLVHVSGHPGKKDLLLLYEKFNPTDIVPIHGETSFIRGHIDYIHSHFKNTNAHFLLNFDSLIVDKNLNITITQGEKLEPIVIHGNNLILEKEKISERRKMACNGSVFISLKTTKSLSGIEKINFTFQGLPNLVTLAPEVFQTFLENFCNQNPIKDLEKTSEEIRIATRRYFDQILGYKPQTFVHIL